MEWYEPIIILALAALVVWVWERGDRGKERWLREHPFECDGYGLPDDSAVAIFGEVGRAWFFDEVEGLVAIWHSDGSCEPLAKATLRWCDDGTVDIEFADLEVSDD